MTTKQLATISKKINGWKTNLKALAVLIVIAVLVLFFTMVLVSQWKHSGISENLEIRGVATIKWEEVNARESYSTKSKSVCSLEKGDLVTLTGKEYQYFISDLYPYWVEALLEDGQTVWIVREAVEIGS